MTREQIMALEGRKLDAAVAEHVMGYRRRIVPKDVDGKHGGTEVLVPASVDHDSFCYPPKGPIPFTFFVPHYSTDIAAAWEVVQHLATPDEALTMTYGKGDWVVAVGSAEVVASSKSAPEAICHAALLSALKRAAEKNGGGEA